MVFKLIVLSLTLAVVGAGIWTYTKYIHLQEQMSGLRDERDASDDAARASHRALEEAQEQHETAIKDWESRLISAREAISTAQEGLRASQERENLLGAQQASLRAELEASREAVSELTEDDMLDWLPDRVAVAYPGKSIVVGAASRPGWFQVDRSGVNIFGEAIEEVLSLRLRISKEREISEERGAQIRLLREEIQAHEEQTRVWESRTKATERILDAALTAKSSISDQLAVADKQIAHLEKMVYFKWWPDVAPGITCGFGMRGQADCVSGVTLSWNLRFR